MKKSCKPLLNFDKQPETTLGCNKFFQRQDIWREDYQKVFKKLTFHNSTPQFIFLIMLARMSCK